MSLESIGKLDGDTVDAVRGLIEVNVDSSKGFEHAAEAIDDDAYSTLFRDFSVQRGRFANELRETLRAGGVEADTHGSALGTAHRWWLDLRDKLTRSDTYDVLDECQRGEEYIAEKYKKILPKVAGNPLNDVLVGQFELIKQGRDRIADLRNLEKRAEKGG